MIEYSIKKYAKHDKDLRRGSVREKIGSFAGIISIVLNIILVIIKISVGFLLSSESVIIDGVNNFFDIISYIIAIVSLKISKRPADKGHPFGHGRIEYFASLAVSILIILVGWDFLKSSFKNIFDYTQNETSLNKFSLIPFILLVLSIFVKVFLGYYNTNLGKKIDSSTLIAAGKDAYGDVLMSMAVVISVLISPKVNFPLDAIVGMIISGIIIFSGVQILIENANELMGKTVSDDVINLIWKEAREIKNVMNIHDVLVSSYGPGTYLATIHIEFPSNLSAMEMHDLSEVFERKMLKEYGIEITVHVDPIDINDMEWLRTKAIAEEVIFSHKDVISIHGFRIFYPDKEKNPYIIFDAIYNCGIINSEKKQNNLRNTLNEEVGKKLVGYTIDAIVHADNEPRWHQKHGEK